MVSVGKARSRALIPKWLSSGAIIFIAELYPNLWEWLLLFPVRPTVMFLLWVHRPLMQFFHSLILSCYWNYTAFFILQLLLPVQTTLLLISPNIYFRNLKGEIEVVLNLFSNSVRIALSARNLSWLKWTNISNFWGIWKIIDLSISSHMINTSSLLWDFLTMNWISYQIPAELLRMSSISAATVCISQWFVSFCGEEGANFDRPYGSTSIFFRIKYSKVNCHPGIGKSYLFGLPFSWSPASALALQIITKIVWMFPALPSLLVCRRDPKKRKIQEITMNVWEWETGMN